MFKQNNLLYTEGRSGGSGGAFSGKSGGQDSGPKPVAKMFLGKMDEQVRGVMGIKDNQRALAYVAACHPEKIIRDLAMASLNDGRELIIVARLSPYFDVVTLAFRKAGKMMGELFDDDLMEVACHSPIEGQRHEALERLRDAIARGRMIMYAESSSRERICLLKLEGASPVQDFTMVMDQKSLEKRVLSCFPLTEQSVSERGAAFSAEQLERII